MCISNYLYSGITFGSKIYFECEFWVKWNVYNQATIYFTLIIFLVQNMFVLSSYTAGYAIGLKYLYLHIISEWIMNKMWLVENYINLSVFFFFFTFIHSEIRNTLWICKKENSNRWMHNEFCTFILNWDDRINVRIKNKKKIRYV